MKKKKHFEIERVLSDYYSEWYKSQRQKKLLSGLRQKSGHDDYSSVRGFTSSTLARNCAKNMGILRMERKNHYPHQPRMGNVFIASRNCLYRQSYLESWVDTSPRSDADAAIGRTTADSFGETASKIFQTGFSHSQKRLVEGESGSSRSAVETIQQITSSTYSSETLNKSGRTHNLSTHFPRTPVVTMQTAKNHESSCRRRPETPS